MNWPTIKTVLLDMDGTLLDKHFDDYFWELDSQKFYVAQAAFLSGIASGCKRLF